MPRSLRLGVPILAVALVAAACGREAEEQPPAPPEEGRAFPVTLTDDEGVEVTVASEPERIVTFAPSHTEILFALGLGDRIVGVSGPFDDFPPEAEAIESIGGAGEFGVDPNEERVVALQPDLLLTAFLGGEWKERLRELDVPVFTTIAESFEDALADIETVGALTGAAEEADVLASEMREQAEVISDAVASEEPVHCFFEIGFNGGFFTVGPGAIEYDLLERAGCEPVTADAVDAYPQWSVEALVEDDPAVYLMGEETGGSPEDVALRPGFGDLAAVAGDRVVLVDSDLISRPGPRLALGLRALAEALHPEAV